MTNDRLSQLLHKYESLKNRFNESLTSYRRGRQVRVLMSCAFWAVVYFLALLILFLLLERTPLQSEFARFIFSGLFYASIVYWLYRGLKAIIYPPTDIGLAVEIEQASEKFNSGLSSAAEFVQQKPTRGISDTLKKLTIAFTTEKLEYSDIKLALKAFSRKKSAFSMMFLFVIAGIWWGLSSGEFITGMKRMIFPLRAITPYTSLSLKIAPGNRILAKGKSLEISAIPNRTTEYIPVLTLFSDNSENPNKVEMYPDRTATFTKYIYNLSSLQESVSYQVTCERFISKRFDIKVMPRPEIKELNLTLHQPGYIATGPVQLNEGVGDCSVLIGTKIDIHGKSSQNLSKALIFSTPGATQTCKITNLKEFSYSFKVATDTTYSLCLENKLGLANENPVTYKIAAVTDASPTVELLKPGKDMPFPTTKRLDIKAVARDDFGVKAMVLYYTVGARKEPIPSNLKPDFSPKPEYQVEYPWMLDTLALQPGTKINYYIEVEDAKTPVPNIASTSIYHISMPSMYDLYRGEEKASDVLTDKLKEFLEAQKMRKESLMKAFEQIRHEEKLDFETRKTIEKAIKDGEKRAKEAGQMLEAFKQLKEKVEDNPFSTPEALERMQKVNELMNEVLDDETKQMMKQLRESLKDLKLDPKDLKKYEEAFKMEDYLKNLDRTIELLTQVKEQQKFNSLGNAIEDLKQRQQMLASQTAELEEKMKKGPLSKEDENLMKDLADQQEKLQKELEDIQKQAQKMAEKQDSEDMPKNSLMEDVKNIRDKMQKEDFKKTAQDIKKSLDKKDPSKAGKAQQKMLKFLESLSKDAKKICRSCSGGAQKQLDLSRFIRKALQVSVDQEKLFRQLDEMPSQFMRGKRPEIEGIIDEVSVLQVLVKQQGARLINSVEKYIRSSFAIDPSVLDCVKDTQTMFSRIVKNLEDRAIQRSRTEQSEIMRRFNKLAIELLKAQDNSNSSSSSSSPQNALQQFKNLTRRQLSLYQKMKRQQGMPANQQTMEQLKKMAMEQRQIREALEKLMRESRQQMNTLGRLDDVLDEMKDIETKSLDPKLRRKIAEKQKKIYERMLKAQKSIKNREEESEERKAKKAIERIQQKVDKPLPKVGSETRDLSKDFLGETREEYPKAYKDLLSDYYKSLNIYGDNE